MNWDDLRICLAVAREGSVTKAARVLGVTHTTVSRRISALEDGLEARLFERLPSGYAPTPLGGSILDAATRMEDAVAEVDLRVKGQDSRLEGSLVVAAPESVVITWLQPKLDGFCKAFPDIALDILVSDEILNLHQRAADVAIRFTNTPSEGLVGRRICHAALATYASREYVATHNLDDPDQLRWLGWHDRTGEAEWIAGPYADAPVHLRTNSLLIMLNQVKAGLGIARLACFVGDREPDLVRLPPGEAVFDRDVWLLTHPELRATARVRAFLDHMYEAMTADRGIMESDATRWRHKREETAG